MKNLLYTTIGLLFLFLSSCGEEDFQANDSVHNSRERGLLPSEITIDYFQNTIKIATVKKSFTYDKQNRLVSVVTTSDNASYPSSTQEITYNENNGTVNTVKSITGSKTFDYMYEYPDKENIIETYIENGLPKKQVKLQINNTSTNLIKREDPEKGTTEFQLDQLGNIVKVGSEQTYTYDDSVGIMSNVKTPHWLFQNLSDIFPEALNLVNNIMVNDKGISYSYKFNDLSKYPMEAKSDDGKEVYTIKYIIAF